MTKRGHRGHKKKPGRREREALRREKAQKLEQAELQSQTASAAGGEERQFDQAEAAIALQRDLVDLPVPQGEGISDEMDVLPSIEEDPFFGDAMRDADSQPRVDSPDVDKTASDSDESMRSWSRSPSYHLYMTVERLQNVHLTTGEVQPDNGEDELEDVQSVREADLGRSPNPSLADEVDEPEPVQPADLDAAEEVEGMSAAAGRA